MKQSEPQRPDGTPADTRTPFQRFTDAARHVFNVPKPEVEKLAEKQKHLRKKK